MRIIKAVSKGVDKASHGNQGIKIMAMSGLYLAIGFLVIHVLTVVQAFIQQGIMAALGSLVFLFLAELYWFVKSWDEAGTPANWYCLVLIAYGISVIVVGIIFRVVLRSGICPNVEELKRMQEQNKQKQNKQEQKKNDDTYTYS